MSSSPGPSKSSLSNPRNYRFLEGKLGLAGNIVETALSGTAAAVLAAWFWGNGAPFVNDILEKIIGGSFGIASIFLGVRQLEQWFYFFDDPGVNANSPQRVNNVGMVPFMRAGIAIASSASYSVVVVSAVLAAVWGFK